MPAFFVHGVPDTAMLWDGIRSELDRKDVIAPTYPGFGTPLPESFDATKDAYEAWLIAEVEAVGEPVDIVGHDWGASLVQRLVSLRPDLVRTWAVGSGPLDDEYVWHDTAKIWQTPGAGEQLMEAFTPDTLAAALSQQGLEPGYARALAEKVDPTMKDCILKLYRSAINVTDEWPPLVRARPSRPRDVRSRRSVRRAALRPAAGRPHRRPLRSLRRLRALVAAPAPSRSRRPPPRPLGRRRLIVPAGLASRSGRAMLDASIQPGG